MNAYRKLIILKEVSGDG